MFLLTTLSLAATPCPEPLTPDALTVQLEAAQRDLGDLDSDGFLDKTADLAQRLPCLAGVLTPPQAARLHQVFGLRAWLGRQTGDARAAFASSKASDPDYVFPFWLLPPSHELRDVYAEAEPDLAILPVLPAKAGDLYFDGVPATVRPQLRPVVLQITDADGKVLTSTWLRPADGLPPYEATRPVLPPLIGSARTLRTGLLTASVVGAVVAAGAYGTAGLANRGFNKARDRDGVFDNQRLANGMVITSGVGAGVAVIAISAAFVVGRI